MKLLRISGVLPLEPFRVRMTLTDDFVIERDLSPLLTGPILEALIKDPLVFTQVTVVDGTLCWPNGADLCPDVIIWNGRPPIAGRKQAEVTTAHETKQITQTA